MKIVDMKTVSVWRAVWCGLMLFVLVSPLHARTFTYFNGRQVEAEFVRLVGNQVTLNIAGKPTVVPFGLFSAADQKFIRESAGAPKLPASQPTDVKWYPGHYMTLHKDWPREKWKKIAGRKRFVGGQRIYTWRQLEPEKDKYDFKAIEADMAYLRHQNQKLILEVWDCSFHGEPSPPVPDYLLGDNYKGGIARPATNSKVVRTKRWVPAVMDRYLLLVKALGQRFDRDPCFVGFIHTETAMEGGGPGFEDFNGYDFDAQMRRLVVDSRKAFPNTPVIVFGNYYSYRGRSGLENLAKCALSTGVGWGGPDLRPSKPTWGYDIIRANAGRMALGLSAQYESLGGKWTSKELLDFATKDLKLNFVFWSDAELRKSGGLSLVEDVIPAVESYGEELSTQRPANLALPDSSHSRR